MFSFLQRIQNVSVTLRQLADNPKRVALLLIDVQDIFTSSGKSATQKIPKLTDAFRKAGGQVYAIHYCSPSNHRDLINFCVYKPHAQDIVIEKFDASAFNGEISVANPHEALYPQKSMKTLLEDNGHNSVLTCGFSYDCCVLNTSKDARKFGFETTVIRDLTNYRGNGYYYDMQSNKKYKEAGVDMTSLNQVLRILQP